MSVIAQRPALQGFQTTFGVHSRCERDPRASLVRQKRLQKLYLEENFTSHYLRLSRQDRSGQVRRKAEERSRLDAKSPKELKHEVQALNEELLPRLSRIDRVIPIP